MPHVSPGWGGGGSGDKCTTGHTRTTCRSPPCSNIDTCKIKDKHPEHKMKVNELQREIKSLESQAAEEEENIKRLASARERAKTSFFAVMRPTIKDKSSWEGCTT